MFRVFKNALPLRKRLQAFCKIYKKNSNTPFTNIRGRNPHFCTKLLVFTVLATKIIFIESFSKCGEAVPFYFEYFLYNDTNAPTKLGQKCAVSFYKSCLSFLNSLLRTRKYKIIVMALSDDVSVFFSTPSPILCRYVRTVGHKIKKKSRPKILVKSNKSIFF